MVCAATSRVDACPCGAPAGAFPAWSALDERLTFTAVTAWSMELGTFDERSRTRSLPPGVSTHRATLDLLASWRPSAPWELTLGVAGMFTSAALPGLRAEGISLGDSTFRARWELPSSAPSRPTLALWSTLRAPTGARDEGANGLSSAGLGHWELALGAELRWAVASRWALSVGLELGARAPATHGGVEITPGPRGAALLLAVWRPSDDIALSIGLSAWTEAPAWVAGVADDVPWSYRVGPALGMSAQLSPALRLLASIAVDPPIDGFGARSPANLRASLGLSWAPLRE